MVRPALDNATPYAFAAAFATDTELRPIYVPLVQVTVSFAPGSEGELSAEQEAIPIGGQPAAESRDESGEVSYRFEPQLAPAKQGTDVVLHGHAWPGSSSATEQLATLRVGPLAKSVRVVGDRVWRRLLGVIRPSRPGRLEPVPLIWERAFGGWDRSHEDPARHVFEMRNPVGLGYRRWRSPFEEDIALPNLEDPRKPLRRWGARPRPACFGFVSPGWKPRVDLAGTYGDRWQRERQPCLPSDFDARFWNAAPEGLASRAPLRGDEPVELRGVSRRGLVRFQLPGLEAPLCSVQLKQRPDARPPLRLDTVIIDADAEAVRLLWRGSVSLRDGPHDVVTVSLQTREREPRSRTKVA